MQDAKNPRRSQQREVIYETLKNTKSHPTAEWIYENVKKVLPDIGIATVYRNLKQMAESGVVKTLETTENKLHYDADLSEHSHFVCLHCGKITDIFLQTNAKESLQQLGYEVEHQKMIFYGKCPNCIENSSN